MLAKIAVIVDFYKCHKTVELFAAWYSSLEKSGIPQIYSRDNVLWVCLAWVFRLPIFSTRLLAML